MPDDTKKYCVSCLLNKKEGAVTPTLDGRCPICSSDSLLSIDALTKFLGSKTNEQNLSVQEENALIDDFGTLDQYNKAKERYIASKPVRPNMVLHEVCLSINKVTIRCVRFAMSENEAIEQAMKDPSQPWYLHDGVISRESLKAKAVNRVYSDPLKDSK